MSEANTVYECKKIMFWPEQQTDYNNIYTPNLFQKLYAATFDQPKISFKIFIIL